MARNFNGVSASVTAAPVTAHPLTMACFFRPPNVTQLQQLMIIRNSGSTNYWMLDARGDLPGDPIRAVAVVTSEAPASSSAAYTANVWNHGCAIFASATSRTIYLNGGNNNSSSTSRDPTGVDRMECPNTNSNNCDMAECGIWSAALTLADVTMLNAGFSPLLVRPDALVYYCPYIGRNSPETDLVGGLSLTLSGASSTIDHPRMIYPASGQSVVTRWHRRGSVFSSQIIEGRLASG